MVGVILYAAKKKHIKMVKHACLLVVVVCFNVCIWLIEQLISWEFEFLSVSYIASEVLLLLLYGILQDYEEREQPVLMEQGMPEAVQTEEKSPENMDFPEAELLSDREKEVLIGMLQDKKRKEIAEELCITENTVKKHVTSIFRKLEVTNRNELIKKLTQN